MTIKDMDNKNFEWWQDPQKQCSVENFGPVWLEYTSDRYKRALINH